MSKMIKLVLAIILILVCVVLISFFVGRAPQQKKIIWGVNFSQMQSEYLQVDWKKNYLALLEDMGVEHIKLITNWSFVEDKKDKYYFDDIDWQVKQAEVHNTKLIYVVGMKTGRWPECHIPGWAVGLSKAEQQDSILAYIKEVVERYKGNKSIIAWQAENEPLFVFGQCPWYDAEFLKKEVALIKSLDSTRPVIVSDSGEQSWWFGAAKTGDIVGITTYRKVWFSVYGKHGFYMNFIYPPLYYWYKSRLIHTLFNKEVISVELQAEPWTQGNFYDTPLKEQEKTMNSTLFKKNIEFAEKTGLKEFYLWGSEYWYWMKEKHQKPELWNEAKKLFKP